MKWNTFELRRIRFSQFCSSELKKTTIPLPQTKKVKKDEPQSKPKKNKHRFALSVENSKFNRKILNYGKIPGENPQIRHQS